MARIISTAAAKHLTPVTLELGGKSPVIIDSDYDFQLAAKRVLVGKTVNSGQVSAASACQIRRTNHRVHPRPKSEK